jgi:hypothetical protein
MKYKYGYVKILNEMENNTLIYIFPCSFEAGGIPGLIHAEWSCGTSLMWAGKHVRVVSMVLFFNSLHDAPPVQVRCVQDMHDTPWDYMRLHNVNQIWNALNEDEVDVWEKKRKKILLK